MKTSPLKTSLPVPAAAQPPAPPPVAPPAGHSRDRTVSPAAAGRVDPHHRNPDRVHDARPAVAASEAPQRIRARRFLGKAVVHHRSRHPAP